MHPNGRGRRDLADNEPAQSLFARTGFTRNHLKFFSPSTLPILLRKAGFGAVVFRPAYGDPIEAGTSALTPRQQARVRRVIDRGNRGNMMRAVAFADPDGPARWTLDTAANL